MPNSETPATERPIASDPHAQKDFLDDWLTYTDAIVSPDIFKTWTGIAMLAAAMERRLWTRTAQAPVYPNLFTVLVSPPGIGKSAILTPAEELLREAKAVKLAPKDTSKAALIDALSRCTQSRTNINAALPLIQYHSLCAMVGELGVLLSAHDLGFLSTLNDLFDNPPTYTQERRTNKLELNIVKPQLNLIVGTQPGFLAEILPESAWSMGTTSRMIMIYGTVSKKINLFGPSMDFTANPLRKALVRHLEKIGAGYGEFQWDDDAQKTMQEWYAGGSMPCPEHSRLTHYLPRRMLYVIKLAMVSSIAKDPETLRVSVSDVNRAIQWLIWAESRMPDIFRDMVGRSDSQVIQELHYYLWSRYAKDKTAIHESRLIAFLSTKVPSERIEKIIDMALRSGVIHVPDALQNKMYVPQPKHTWGLDA